MQRLEKWGLFLIILAVVLHFVGFLGGIFDKWIPSSGVGILPVGDSPEAVFLHSLIATCLINAISVLLISSAISKTKR